MNGTWTTLYTGWEPLTMAGDVGQWYILSNDFNVMFGNLMEVLEDTACAPTSE